MKKVRLKFIYIIVVILICIIPFLCIGFAGMEESTEDDKVEMPKLTSKGEWNVDFLSDLGDWYEENFAFRQEMVSANARLLADVFHVSATDEVITGSDGWLYYSSTLDDYKGENVLSDRGIFNIAHTVALMQQAVEDEGSTFVFTIAPNKNTLYDENMPYYEKKTGTTSNLEKVAEQLKEEEVNYVDLYQLFKDQDEVLYLKTDSHWNNKGALLAYNAIMEAAGWPHNEYKNTEPTAKKDYIGDLAKMLYPNMATKEENLYYPQIFSYDYIGDNQSVEDSEVSTVGYSGTGSLLMYRDSFGNTLIPFMAGEFGTSFFSKLVPYYIDEELDETDADVVVVEKVERHLETLGSQPPVMEASEVKLTKQKIDTKETDTTFQTGKIEDDMYMAMGVIDDAYLEDDSLIYVKITGSDNESAVYEAFPVTMESDDESTDNGYQIYLNDKTLPKGEVTTEIIIKTGDSLTTVKTDQSDWRK